MILTYHRHEVHVRAPKARRLRVYGQPLGVAMTLDIFQASLEGLDYLVLQWSCNNLMIAPHEAMDPVHHAGHHGSEASIQILLINSQPTAIMNGTYFSVIRSKNGLPVS